MGKKRRRSERRTERHAKGKESPAGKPKEKTSDWVLTALGDGVLGGVVSWLFRVIGH